MNDFTRRRGPRPATSHPPHGGLFNPDPIHTPDNVVSFPVLSPFDPEAAGPSDWAAMYRAFGWQVLPAHSPTTAPEWKRPAVNWTRFQREMTTDDEFGAWYGPAGQYRAHWNMGAVTGVPPRRQFVVDLDLYKGPAAAAWWQGLLAVHNNNMELETVEIVTGGGGRQFAFGAPDDWAPPTFRSPEHVDVRGVGGFHMLPASWHESGRRYAFAPGRAPWEIEVATAPSWLCVAIDKLRAEGGETASARERAPGDGSDHNAFGLRIDGRDDAMARMVWAAVVDLRREAPIPPDAGVQVSEVERLWVRWEQTTKSRLDPASHPGRTNGELLELEDRGRSMLERKFQYALDQWDTKVAEAAKVPKAETAPSSPTAHTPVPATGPTRGITAAALKNLHFAPVAWVVPDLVTEGLTLFAGKPKVGKSWLVLDAAIAVATGGQVLGRSCEEGDVLVAALEDPLRRLKRRMDKLIPFGPWPERLTLWDKMSRLEEGGFEQLREWIRSAPKPRLIMIDVYARVRRPKGSREQLYDYDYTTAAALKELADETGVAIVVVHHQRKLGADDDPFDTVSGSTGLTGASDTVLLLLRAASGVTLYGRGRDVEEVELAVCFDKNTGRWSALGAADVVRMSSPRRAIHDALRTASGPLSPKQVAAAIGQDNANVRQLLNTMANAGEVQRADGKYWLANGP